MITLKQKIEFSVADAKVIENLDTSSFALLSIDAFASGDNEHNMPVSLETLKELLHQLKTNLFYGSIIV